jgi:predicted ester cyclase
MRKAIEAMNEYKNPALLDAFAAPDYVDHTNQLNRERAKQFYVMTFRAFPDYHRTIEDIIAEGDKVWVYSTTTMTHTGEFRGVAPTGKNITITGVNIYRVVNGKMVEGWNVTDSLDLFTQLGVIEYTEQAKGLIPEDAASQLSLSTRESAILAGQGSLSLDENKAIIRSLYAADNAKDWTMLDEVISPDFVEATLQLRGPEAYHQFITTFFTGFPDWHETLEDMIAEGDKVWVDVKGIGTHTGEFWGIAPTDKTITIMMVQMWRLVDGKVVEKRSVADELDTYTQAGVIEYTETAKNLFPDEISVTALTRTQDTQ